jgi:hypothetical protein
MVARWDVLLVAAVLSGGSVMIENSHRVDTGLADAPAAAALPACAEPAAGRAESVSDNASDTHFVVSAADNASGARFVVSAADDDPALSVCD